VRFVFNCLFACIAILPARAQEQENKLVDRLLKPNTTLQNSAQGKAFLADGASINKKASIATFFVRARATDKNFGGERKFAARDFGTAGFRDTAKDAFVAKSGWVSNAKRPYHSQPAWAVGAASESGKSSRISEFTTRAFPGRGKSQKAISQHDTPLTVEQVRELLNKNK
jgi:hypothetical protein